MLRTTPLLYGLKDKYPGAGITWLTEKNAVPVLENNDFIDEILTIGEPRSRCSLKNYYNLVINLDKDTRALKIATGLDAWEKFGFGIKGGRIVALNSGSEYAVRLGLDDELKFRRNKKTYQEVVFEQCRLRYAGQPYILNLSERQVKFSENFLKRHKGIRRSFKIGLNTGCGPKYPKKKWTIDGFVKLATALRNAGDTQILLLGGLREVKRNKEIKQKIKFPVIDTGTNNSLSDFISIINCCDLVVTGDTVAMHIAIALKKKVVALFGPTSPGEIDLYNRGIKVVSKIHCAPCYKNACDKKPDCMSLITADEVFNSVK